MRSKERRSDWARGRLGEVEKMRIGEKAVRDER